MDICEHCKGIISQLKQREELTTDHAPALHYDRGRQYIQPKKANYTDRLGHGSVERRMYDLYKR